MACCIWPGYDHERASDAEVMEPLEVKILAELGIADPYAHGAPPDAMTRLRSGATSHSLLKRLLQTLSQALRDAAAPPCAKAWKR